MSLDEHMIEIGVLIIGFASNFGVMRWMIGKHEATLEKIVDKLNSQDTEQKLQKQTLVDLEASNTALREIKHDHANRLQALEFKTIAMDAKLTELDRRRKR